MGLIRTEDLLLSLKFERHIDVYRDVTNIWLFTYILAGQNENGSVRSLPFLFVGNG